MRSEQEIFDELAEVCGRSGYAHAIAYLCYESNIVRYNDQLQGEDYAKLFDKDRLIRTELSTLIGLMVRKPPVLAVPLPDELNFQIQRSKALLEEMHDAMKAPWLDWIKVAAKSGESSFFDSGEAMREAIFYGAESAYPFQYRDLAPNKYARDDVWLAENKGFSCDNAKQILTAIRDCLSKKFAQNIVEMKGLSPDRWTLLPGFTLSTSDVVAESGLSEVVVGSFLRAFSIEAPTNPNFTALHEFNCANAYPLMRTAPEEYVIFQYAALAEATYETPFYWMMDDSKYKETALQNRGTFAEEFAAERLEKVFGANNVFRNVRLYESKAKEVGEIDVLILFASRAIVVQAKSKKLTQEARKGNDLQLKTDFKQAVQDACDQACKCSAHLSSPSLSFVDGEGKKIAIPASIVTVHPICVVSEHYPALSHQTHSLLKFELASGVVTPFVCDVFLLDTLTEMLESPLRCLSFLELRAKVGMNLLTSHEHTALGYHLKQNLWLGEFDLMQLEDSVSADLDVAMAVRRDGVSGARTPTGILTFYRGTWLGRAIDEIERSTDAGSVELGLELLKLGSDAGIALSKAVDRTAAAALKDGKEHNASMLLGDDQVTGITVHCNRLGESLAALKLKSYCEQRKYKQHASRWYGIVVTPGTADLRLGLILNYPWEADEAMDKRVASMQEPMSMKAFEQLLKSGVAPKRKIGRNQPCPCGSGRKYKKCHLLKDTAGSAANT